MAGLPPAKLSNPGGRGAKGGTRTPTGLPAGTLIQCVYQFRHSRVAATPGHPRKHGTGPAHRMPPTAATLTLAPGIVQVDDYLVRKQIILRLHSLAAQAPQTIRDAHGRTPTAGLAVGVLVYWWAVKDSNLRPID